MHEIFKHFFKHVCLKFLLKKTRKTDAFRIKISKLFLISNSFKRLSSLELSKGFVSKIWSKIKLDMHLILLKKCLALFRQKTYS